MADTTSFLMLQPGRDLWLSVGNLPEHVMVTGLTGDQVAFKRVPIFRETEEMRIEATAFLGYARKGTKTRLDQMARFMRTDRARSMKDVERSWVETEIQRLMSILLGEPVPTKAETDYLHMTVQVKAVDVEGDPWVYLDGLTGGCCNSLNPDTGVYDVSVVGVDELVRLQGNPRIEVLRYDVSREW